MKQIVTRNFSNLGFGTSIIVMIIVIVFAAINLRILIESNNKVSHTLIVLGELDKTLALLTDAETSQRGYIITGEERFLEAYNAAVSPNNGISHYVQELRQLTSDNPSQQQRLDVLDPLVMEKLAFVQETIDLRRNTGFDAAQKAVLTDKGRQIMDNIRQVLAEMQKEEKELLLQRSNAAFASLQYTLITLITGAGLSISLLSLSYYMVNREVNVRRRAEEALQQLNRELDKRVEQRTSELVESERNFRDLADSALIGIYRSTIKGEILYVNQTLARMLGYDSPEEMTRGGALLHYRDPQIRQTFIEKLQREGEVESYELALLTKSGQSLTALISARIKGEQLTGTLLDITERKQAEEQLHASERQLNFTLEAIHTGGWDLDLVDHTAHRTLEHDRIFGYASLLPEWTYEMFLEHVLPEDRAEVERSFGEAVAAQGSWGFECRIRRVDGEVRWIWATGQHQRDETGQIRRMAGVVQDITERKRAEEKLIASELRYRRLFEAARDGILILDAETGMIVDVNPFLIEMLGFSKEEFLGNKLWELGFFKDIAESKANFLELQQKEYIRYEDLPLETTNGRRFHVEFVSNVYQVDGNKVIQCNIRDITERKRAEQTLSASESRYRRFFEAARDGILILDHETGMVVDVNPFLVEMLGYSREQFFGKRIWELGFFKDIAANKLNFTELQQKEFIQYENLPLETAEGRLINVEFVSHVYQVDGNKVIQCNIRDITERKRAEEALRESEARYRHTLDNLMEGCQLIGFDWRYHYVNDLAAEQGRQTKDGLLGHTMMEVYPGIENTAMFAALRRCMEERISHRIENEFAYPDGTQGWFELNIQPVPEGIFILSADITDRKCAEEDRLARETAERANKAKSEFLSRMSHELRTPMNSILGFTQLLKMDELTPDQLGSLEQILKSGRHLLDLINEVLDISRIEAGNMSISPEPVQLDEALESATDLIRPMADKRGISIEIRIPSSRDIFVTADRQRLKQVLLNLLSNAVKYNRENGQIHITASLLMDGYLHLAVRDTGYGIPPEKMDRLFIPFDRLELDPAFVEGTGLGLALSKGLVEAMGGRIGAQSVLGEGSTFWFDLKLTTQQKEAIVMAEVDDYLKDAPGLRKGLVLYVEDNLSNIQLIEKVLARLPEVKLVSAMQGRLALDLARLHKPGLILLDLDLPDVHGSDVLKWLRAEPETKDIPIIIMSADATPGQIEKMLAAGANAYLTKPIDVKEFLKMVGETLGS